jgi:parallel beta-helix repeat protein
MYLKVGITDGDICGDNNLALQAGIEYLGAKGGGTLEIGPGRYLMHDSLKLRSNVRVLGSGPKTVLVKAPGPESPMRIDCDWGQMKVTPGSSSGFEVGMGVSLGDDRHPGWGVSVSSITHIERGSLFLADNVTGNYTTENNGFVSAAVSVVSGADIHDASIENLLVDGCSAGNPPINGCRGAGIYLFKARRCTISGCTVRKFNGDGISFQVTEDCIVDNCLVEKVSGLGIHPGTGSARPVVMNCSMQKNGLDGLFICWRVQDGVFENCRMINNGRHGISIGHKDTDNLFRGNLISGNGYDGIHFRPEKPSNAGSRNRFEDNRIECNGRKGDAAAVAVYPATKDLEFINNRIRSGKSSSKLRGQKTAFRLYNNASRPKMRGNRISLHPQGQVQKLNVDTPEE